MMRSRNVGMKCGCFVNKPVTPFFVYIYSDLKFTPITKSNLKVYFLTSLNKIIHMARGRVIIFI